MALSSQAKELLKEVSTQAEQYSPKWEISEELNLAEVRKAFPKVVPDNFIAEKSTNGMWWRPQNGQVNLRKKAPKRGGQVIKDFKLAVCIANAPIEWNGEEKYPKGTKKIFAFEVV